jgi:hypothetical protein
MGMSATIQVIHTKPMRKNELTCTGSGLSGNGGMNWPCTSSMVQESIFDVCNGRGSPLL